MSVMSQQQPDELDRLRLHRRSAEAMFHAYLRASQAIPNEVRVFDVNNWCVEQKHYTIREVAALGVLMRRWASDHDRDTKEAMMPDVLLHASRRIMRLESRECQAARHDGEATPEQGLEGR